MNDILFLGAKLRSKVEEITASHKNIRNEFNPCVEIDHDIYSNNNDTHKAYIARAVEAELKYQNVTKENGDIKTKCESLLSELAKNEQALVDSKFTIRKLSVENEKLLKDNEKQKRDSCNFESYLLSLKAEEDNLKSIVCKIQDSFMVTREELSTLTALNKESLQKNNAYETIIQDLRNQINNLHATIDLLNSKIIDEIVLKNKVTVECNSLKMKLENIQVNAQRNDSNHAAISGSVHTLTQFNKKLLTERELMDSLEQVKRMSTDWERGVEEITANCNKTCNRVEELWNTNLAQQLKSEVSELQARLTLEAKTIVRRRAARDDACVPRGAAPCTKDNAEKAVSMPLDTSIHEESDRCASDGAISAVTIQSALSVVEEPADVASGVNGCLSHEQTRGRTSTSAVESGAHATATATALRVDTSDTGSVNKAMTTDQDQEMDAECVSVGQANRKKRFFDDISGMSDIVSTRTSERDNVIPKQISSAALTSCRDINASARNQNLCHSETYKCSKCGEVPYGLMRICQKCQYKFHSGCVRKMSPFCMKGGTLICDGCQTTV